MSTTVALPRPVLVEPAMRLTSSAPPPQYLYRSRPLTASSIPLTFAQSLIGQHLQRRSSNGPPTSSMPPAELAPSPRPSPREGIDRVSELNSVLNNPSVFSAPGTARSAASALPPRPTLARAAVASDWSRGMELHRQMQGEQPQRERQLQSQNFNSIDFDCEFGDGSDLQDVLELHEHLSQAVVDPSIARVASPRKTSAGLTVGVSSVSVPLKVTAAVDLNASEQLLLEKEFLDADFGSDFELPPEQSHHSEAAPAAKPWSFSSSTTGSSSVVGSTLRDGVLSAIPPLAPALPEQQERLEILTRELNQARKEAAEYRLQVTFIFPLPFFCFVYLLFMCDRPTDFIH